MAWMRHYNGITLSDYPINGGKHIEEEGYGHEVINFQVNGRYVYGYTQAKNATIEINRIGGKGKDFIDDVLVVWRARSEKIGSVIVGWYKNARVYRHEQDGNRNRVFTYDGENYYPRYHIRARATDAFLIPAQRRNFQVPVTHKGFGSRTFVSFLDKDIKEVNTFKKLLIEYIERAERGNFASPNRGKRGVIAAIPGQHKMS
ncbi:hypothetical protein [Candidatus Venteria ishoeyi]|nr:hypothetical protein [Candidatus Venteria ishoeyi]